MPRRPTGSQLADQVADLVKVLKLAQQVFPHLAEQARLELNELRGGLPEASAATCDLDDCDGGPHAGWPRAHPAHYEHSSPPPGYTDPTGEAVIHFRPTADGDCRPVEDLERIARWVADVQHLIGSTRKMLNQAPAMTLAVVDGRRPTDGRSAEEHAQRKFVRVLSGEPCMIGQDHDEQDRFGPGQLRRGLCNRHRMAFERWCEDQPVLPLERAGRLARWQMAAFGTVWDPEKKTGKHPEGPYKTDLREVA